MRRTLFALVLAAAAVTGISARSPQAKPTLSGPDVMIIGGKMARGSCRSFLIEYKDFTIIPMIDVSTAADGVSFRDLVITPTGAGTGTFQFTMDYEAAKSTDTFRIEIVGHGGTGGTNATTKKTSIEVRRL